DAVARIAVVARDGRPREAVAADADLAPVAHVGVDTVRIAQATAGNGRVCAADRRDADVLRADGAVVAAGRCAGLAAEERLAGLRPVARVAVVAGGRDARHTVAVDARLDPVADVVVITVGGGRAERQ